MFNLFL